MPAPKPHIRADYEYLLRLAIIYLGGTPPGGSKFRPPLALSSARFMGRIIYSLTIEMFARTGEFAVDAGLLSRLREVNTFFVTVYIEAWFTAPHSLSAARRDLHFVKVLLSYKDIYPEVSIIAIASFRNHLWSGAQHGNADALSRQPCEEGCRHCARHEVAVNSNAIADVDLPTRDELRAAQSTDLDIMPILLAKQRDERPLPSPEIP
ncbi:Biotin synthase [Frankliniella fusca]|uniref:Biotin synthase n=1 Tax=Frankliniella fusca TaxID=407009 RepID=A0AAE1L8R6_9NEOP|nr:Biotin synthase [Frankliniella fusca]